MLKQLLRKVFFDNACSLCNCQLQREKYICLKCEAKLEKMSNLKKRGDLYYLYYYTDVKKIIFDLKFKNRKGVSESLSKYVEDSIREIIKKEKIDTVISVPVSQKRILERGYNQVDELLKSANINYENIKRLKNTKQMYKLKDRKAREANVNQAFFIEGDYSQKNILIVDDIVTTGSTLKEIKKEFLEKKKSNKVIFFTISVVRDYFK
ncbi:ComF family protein [Cetobacterium somerae]|uniref:ComF family protein n=1 Tax=Cetobacterium somerae TaxID=188913 RepID=UPI003D76927C